MRGGIRVFQTVAAAVVITAATVAVSGSAAQANGCEGDPATCVSSKPTTPTTVPPAPTTTTVAPTPTTVPVVISTTNRLRNQVAVPAPTTTTLAPVPAVDVLGIQTECQAGVIAVPVRNSGTGTGEVTASMRGKETTTSVAPGETQVMNLDLGPADQGKTRTVTVSGDAIDRQRVTIPCGGPTANIPKEECHCSWFSWWAFLLGLGLGTLVTSGIWTVVSKRKASQRDEADEATPEDDGSDPEGA
jgi:hypothetical protein